MLYRVHLTLAGFELTTLVVIGIECIGKLYIQLPYDHDGPRGYEIRLFSSTVQKQFTEKNVLYNVCRYT
jgi:hypothetical protein